MLHEDGIRGSAENVEDTSSSQRVNDIGALMQRLVKDYEGEDRRKRRTSGERLMASLADRARTVG